MTLLTSPCRRLLRHISYERDRLTCIVGEWRCREYSSCGVFEKCHLMEGITNGRHKTCVAGFKARIFDVLNRQGRLFCKIKGMHGKVGTEE